MSPSQRSAPDDWQATRGRSVQPVPDTVLQVVYEDEQSRAKVPSAVVSVATSPWQVTVGAVAADEKQPASSPESALGPLQPVSPPPHPFLERSARTKNDQRSFLPSSGTARSS